MMAFFARVALARFRHLAKPFSPFPCKPAQVRAYAAMGLAWACFFPPLSLLRGFSLLLSIPSIPQLQLFFGIFTIVLSRHGSSHLSLSSVDRVSITRPLRRLRALRIHESGAPAGPHLGGKRINKLCSRLPSFCTRDQRPTKSCESCSKCWQSGEFRPPSLAALLAYIWDLRSVDRGVLKHLQRMG